MNKELLRVEHITKKFGKIQALKGVSMSVHEGEIISVVGENGAGKSTLMNVMTGIYQPTSGKIFLHGKETRFKSALDAIKNGICIVHQEIANCPDISVAENIFMSEIIEGKGHFVNYKKINEEARKLLAVFECKIQPEAKLSTLSISEQQIVEIAKALAMKPQVIIFDEPTSSLTKDETEKLIRIIFQLKEQGLGILYISHRMEEVFRLSDTELALRDGEYIDSKPIGEISNDWIISKITGRTIEGFYPPKSIESGPPVLEVHDFSDQKRFQNISFALKEKEILGFYGLVGAGRSELMRAVVGAAPKKSGTLKFKGNVVSFKNYKQAIDRGIIYLTEDRKKEGLFLKTSIESNMKILNLEQISSHLFVRDAFGAEEAKKYTKTMNVKCSGLDQVVGTLSGGNQQKIMIAKALSVNPQIIILDEPTRGIDVGAKTEIYQTIRNLADKGVGIIVVSSELPEIIGLCDKVCVMYEGRMVGEVRGEDINESTIIGLASNLKEATNE